MRLLSAALRSPLFVVLAPLVTGCGDGDGGPRSLADTARIVVEAMKSGDASKIDATLPAEAEIEKAFRAGLDEAPADQKERAEKRWKAKGGAKGVRDGMRDKMRERVASAREAAAKDLDWSKAEFERAEEPAKTSALGPDAVVGDVAFFVKAEGISFRFRSKEAMRFPSGWNFSEGWLYVGPDVPHDARVDELAAALAKLQEAGKSGRERASAIVTLANPWFSGSGEVDYAKLRAALGEWVAAMPTKEEVSTLESKIVGALESSRVNREDRQRLESLRSDLAFLAMGRHSVESDLAFLRDETRSVAAFRGRLSAEVEKALSSPDGPARVEAERLATWLELEVAVPHFAALYDAAKGPDARLAAAEQLTAAGGREEAVARLLAWIADASRPSAERARAFLAVRWSVPEDERVALAIAAGPEAVSAQAEQFVTDRDPRVLSLMSHLPEPRRAPAWRALLGGEIRGVAPETLWATVATDDTEVAARRVQALLRLDAAALEVVVSGVPPRDLALVLRGAAEKALGAQAPRVEAVGAAAASLTIEHRGPGVVAALLASLRGAGIEARMTDDRLLLGAPKDLEVAVARDARLPSTVAVPGDPPWKREIRAWLAARDAIPFFSQGEPTANFLIGVHFFGPTSVAVLPGLAARATDAVSLKDDLRPRTALLRPLLERYDAKAVLRDGALVLGLRDEVDALPADVPTEAPAGLPAAWTSKGAMGYHVTQPRLARAVELLPAAVLDSLDVAGDVRARFADTPAPFVRLEGDRATGWNYARLVLLGTPFEARAAGGRVRIAAR